MGTFEGLGPNVTKPFRAQRKVRPWGRPRYRPALTGRRGGAGQGLTEGIWRHLPQEALVLISTVLADSAATSRTQPKFEAFSRNHSQGRNKGFIPFLKSAGQLVV